MNHRIESWVKAPDPRVLLKSTDPEVYQAIEDERAREILGIELIAPENYASPAVMAAQGALMTNKYAEGYPGRRYYGGCEFVDVVERLAIERAKELFGAEHANVQSHSGAQANMAAYMAILQPGDTVLAMKLSHGGHLTHGASFNFSGKLYHFFHYGVNRETERLDYDEIAEMAREHRPKLILAGASAYPRVIDFPRLREIADEVGAYLMVDMAHIAGLVAAGVHPSPIPYSDIVTTTTHKTLRGPRSGMIFCKAELARAIDRAVFPGTQGGPLMHVVAAKAVALKEAMTPEFKEYQKQIVVNMHALVDGLKAEGLRLVSGGSDNHLALVDLTPAGVTGAQAEKWLENAGITVNKNLIPFDPLPSRKTSGIRVGTPAVTTRGMGPDEMRQIARWIGEVLRSKGDEEVCNRVKSEVQDLCLRFPIPGYY